MPTTCALFKLDMQTNMFLGLIHATQAICKKKRMLYEQFCTFVLLTFGKWRPSSVFGSMLPRDIHLQTCLHVGLLATPG